MLTSRRILTPLGAWLGVALLTGAGTGGRWIGQDGHDLVGCYSQPGKSDIQDMHFQLNGLPPGAKVVSAIVKGGGGGEWKLNGPANSWLALFVQAPGATTADVYIEPYIVEKGRDFEFQLTFDDGRKEAFYIRGGRADPNLRMPTARMEVRWIGQDGHDLATSSPNVGPDGIQDVHLSITKLSPKEEVRSVLISGPGELRWQSGSNVEAHTGAEFVRSESDKTRADLYFHPSRDLAGQTLKIALSYKSGKIDTANVAAGRCDPATKAARPVLPELTTLALKSTWLGQGGGSGNVVVSLAGLPTTGRVVGLELSDGVVGHWSDRGGNALPLTLRRGADPSKAELSFPPVRDESGASLTLRLIYADGRNAVGSFPGGPADPSLRAPAPEGTSGRAKPGDDLNDLANRFGTLTLASGTYSLARPLVLNRPVTITSEGGATLVFSQAASEPAWTTAIKIHSGRVTLDRLAIRFAGPVRWDREVSYGPAVIGTTDNRDKPTGQILNGLTFTRLDVQAPPPATSWEEAPRLFRVVGESSGVIEGNVLKGGTIELFRGPWRIVDNRQDGTHAGAFNYTMIGIHDPHDVLIAKNRAKPLERGGKSWRWLVLTGRGENISVEDNVIEGVGPRDDDKVPDPNSPETILTESYKLNFEGKPSGASADGRVLAIPKCQGYPVEVGAVVAILSGPEAGHWRRVVLPLGPEMFLLDRPVALGGGAISIENGFVATRIERNNIDDRGSRIATPFTLAGSHFGTRLNGNTARGGWRSCHLVASASEFPVHWGWSHNPVFGLVVEGNTFEDAREGTYLFVEQNEHVRASRGRVYLTATLTNNTFGWSDAFLSAHRGAAPPDLTLGHKLAGDAGQQVVVLSGNRRRGGASGPSVKTQWATVNGREVRDEMLDIAAGKTSSKGP
jgi:hypothetical protein